MCQIKMLTTIMSIKTQDASSEKETNKHSIYLMNLLFKNRYMSLNCTHAINIYFTSKKEDHSPIMFSSLGLYILFCSGVTHIFCVEVFQRYKRIQLDVAEWTPNSNGPYQVHNTHIYRVLQNGSFPPLFIEGQS